MNKLFGLVPNAIKSLFTPPTVTVTSAQTTAISDIGGHFAAIATIMEGGRVSPEYADFALGQLYAAQLVINGAVTHGWNNASPSKY
jgi:hypothetical protein